MIIWALSRAEAVDFASYMDWEDVCEAMPEGHPIIAVPVPYMRAFELPSVDPRLAAFDFNAIRVADLARRDQGIARMRNSRFVKRPYDSDQG